MGWVFFHHITFFFIIEHVQSNSCVVLCKIWTHKRKLHCVEHVYVSAKMPFDNICTELKPRLEYL